jgi:hypothetical protein
LGEYADEEALIEAFGEPGPEEELENEEDVGGDLIVVSICEAGSTQGTYSEQVGLECAKAKRA